MPSNSQPRVAIIGAGPGGLTLGLLLHNRGIDFTIFELRQKPTDEELSKPSGMLDLHEESGIAAIKECGLLDEFWKLTGECTQADKVSDKDGNILHADEGETGGRPEISRHNLTKLLISNIPAEKIKWGHKLFSASEEELDFGPQGKQSSFDLVVGADGAWSKVRRLLTDVQPQYGGKHFITLTITDITAKYPHLADLVGSGSFSALGNRHGVMSQRGPQDSARIYIFLSTPDPNFGATMAELSPVAAKEKLLNDPALLGPFGPKLKELVSTACDEESGAAVDVRALYQLPADTSWTHKTGFTVIGDAAHVMLPFAGEGVNLAMWDSLLLAHAIIEADGNMAEVDALVKEFEVEMAARAKDKAEESISNGEMMFSENGAEAFRDFFQSFRPPPPTVDEVAA